MPRLLRDQAGTWADLYLIYRYRQAAFSGDRGACSDLEAQTLADISVLMRTSWAPVDSDLRGEELSWLERLTDIREAADPSSVYSAKRFKNLVRMGGNRNGC
jgi:hypothetical protein